MFFSSFTAVFKLFFLTGSAVTIPQSSYFMGKSLVKCSSVIVPNWLSESGCISDVLSLLTFICSSIMLSTLTRVQGIIERSLLVL